MLINEIRTRTGLTKKAIEYYIAQGLLSPAVLANGYRDFSDNDAERLARISVLRKLDLSLSEIKDILGCASDEALKAACARGAAKIATARRNYELLSKLAIDNDYAAAARELCRRDSKASIAERIVVAFPGAFGKFLSLHFAGFLSEPIATAKQRAAYADVVDFLDAVPELPDEVRDWLENGMGELDAAALKNIDATMREAIAAPRKFIGDNADMLEQYMSYLQSGEYLRSPARRMRAALRDFCAASGYWEKFIPAMKRLSPAYARYQKSLEIANAAFLTQYPRAGEL